MRNRIDFASLFKELAIAYGETVEGSFVPCGEYKALERRFLLAERLVREGRQDEALAVVPEVARRTRPDEYDDFWACESCWGKVGDGDRFCPNCGAVLVGDVGVYESLEAPIPSAASWVASVVAEVASSGR